MQIYPLILRLFHIASGVFWAGTAMFFAGFLGPTVKQLGPDGGKVMGVLNKDGRVTRALSIAAGLTMLSGILLYIFSVTRSGGFSTWIASLPGIGFTVGAVAGLASGAVGGGLVGRLTTKVGALGAQLAAAGGPPPAEKLAEMGALQKQLDQWSRINVILLVIAVIAMAISRYL